jgi:LPS sulfotransferase NodH
MARTDFLVLTTQRNGSTWLMSVLNNIEGVTAHGELLLPRPRTTEPRWDSDFARKRYVESRAEYGALRPFSVFRYLDAVYADRHIVGFKLMYSQLRRYPEVLPYSLWRRIGVIHLVRRNHLDVLVSFAIKRQIERAHILQGQEHPRVRVRLAPDSLVRDIKRLQLKHGVARRLLRVTRLRHIEVGYEELIRDASRFEDVFRFLNLALPVSVPRSNIVRTRAGSQRDVIENYDEVRRALAGTPYSSLLD